MPLHRSPYARTLLLVAILASTLSAPCASSGAPQASDPDIRFRSYLPFTNDPVSIVATGAAVPSTGNLDYTAVVRLDEPAEYLQVRIQVRRPSGKLLYQKTQVGSGLPAGVQSFRFSRPLTDLELKPGAYPVELNVRANGTPIRDWTVNTTLRVYDPSAPAFPVALLVKIASPPQTDPAGRFVVDPGVETAARDGARAVADAVLGTPQLHASLAIPPVLLEEWKHISQGYEIVGGGGVTSVDPQSPTPVSYERTLARLHEAIGTGRLELVDVPYADPDLTGLQSIGRPRDLQAQLTRGAPVYAAALDATQSAGMFTADAALTRDLALRASKRGIRYAVVSADLLRRGDATASAGAYRSTKIPLTVLVPDRSLAGSATVGDANALLDRLFTRSLSKKRPKTLPVTVEIGPGATRSLGTLLGAAQRAAAEPWLTFVTAEDAADGATSASLVLADRLPPDGNPPADFWPTVAEARRHATAYSSAAPANDQDAAAATTDSLIAECAYWAGADDRWALADRARGFAASTLRRAKSTFDRVSVTGENVTLSGTAGSVPFSVTNADERPLTVTIKAAGPAVRVPFSSRRTLAPGESYVTVPVDLRHTVEQQVALQVVAGDVTLASRAVTVRASYLDRVAILSAIVLVLIGMLIYISRRVRRADNTHST